MVCQSLRFRTCFTFAFQAFFIGFFTDFPFFSVKIMKSFVITCESQGNPNKNNCFFCNFQLLFAIGFNIFMH